MSKYHALWAYIDESGKPHLTLTFDEISQIAGVPLDHSFLKYKKELCSYGYEVIKISLKAQTVLFAQKKEADYGRKNIENSTLAVMRVCGNAVRLSGSYICRNK